MLAYAGRGGGSIFGKFTLIDDTREHRKYLLNIDYQSKLGMLALLGVNRNISEITHRGVVGKHDRHGNTEHTLAHHDVTHSVVHVVWALEELKQLKSRQKRSGNKTNTYELNV